MISYLPPGDLGHSLGDVGIGPAAADVAAHSLAHLRVGCLLAIGEACADMAGHPGLDLFEHRYGRTDLPRRAIAALKAVMLDEGRLHRVQIIRRAEALDCGDLVAFMHHSEAEAGINSLTTNDDGAGATLTVVAALYGAGKLQMFAQRVEQSGAGVEV